MARELRVQLSVMNSCRFAVRVTRRYSDAMALARQAIECYSTSARRLVILCTNTVAGSVKIHSAALRFFFRARVRPRPVQPLHKKEHASSSLYTLSTFFRTGRRRALRFVAACPGKRTFS